MDTTAPNSLPALRQILKAAPPGDSDYARAHSLPVSATEGGIDWCDLPTFGGAAPKNTSGVWSWDETQLLVGDGLEDLRIVQRSDIPKARTITLTDRPPVRIREDEWPIVAEANGDSYVGNDYARHQRALGQGGCDTYSLRVRQHTDGRTLVYAVLGGASAWTGTEVRREGVLMGTVEQGDRSMGAPSGASVAAVIAEVGMTCGLPDSVVRDCIADLPAEEI